MNRRLFHLLIPLLLLSACAGAPKQIRHYDTSFTAIDSAQGRDNKLEAMLLPYRKGVDTVMNIVVGYSAVPLSKAQPESTLGNFMADAQLAYARQSDSTVGISVQNYGGIRLPYISAGAITKGRLYELMPFDNKLTIIEISGKTLRQFCDHIAANGGWPVSGITFKIKNEKAVDILAAGSPVDDEKMYKVALPDYVANGGDRCDFLTGSKRTMLNLFIRDILIGYVQQLNSKGQQINASLEKRISYAQ